MEVLNFVVGFLAIASGTYAGAIAVKHGGILPGWWNGLLIALMLICYGMAGLNFWLAFR